MMIYAPHKINRKGGHYTQVLDEMRQRGAPLIRVIDMGDYYGAIEGSHRLAAAHKLGLTPILDVIDIDSDVELTHDLPDVDSPCKPLMIAEYLRWDQVAYNFQTNGE